MSTTKDNFTPGGTSDSSLVNPSSSEAGLKDSGGGQTLQKNPDERSTRVTRPSIDLPSKWSNSLTEQNYTRNALYYGNLEDENEKLRDRVLQIEKLLGIMSNEIHSFQVENEALKKAQISEDNKNQNVEVKELTKDAGAPGVQTFSTDEEELDRETNWILKKRKPTKRQRKRTAESSPEYDEPMQGNRTLGSDPTKENVNRSKADAIKKAPETIKQKAPPPIMVSNIVNYSLMNKDMKEIAENFTATLLNNNQLKINVKTDTEYRNVTKYLNEQAIQWHSYENKQTRPIRVMVRKLHPSCPTEDIKEDLERQGLKIISVTNKLKKSKVNGEEIATKLPLFMLAFSHSEDIKKIYGIKYLCHMRVTLEPVKGNGLIPQCKKCQRYGHTQSFCQRQPICVKCAGEHLTAVCDTIIVKPKCANCAEEHPASYRGCVVAKELQKRRDNQTRPKTLSTQVRTFQSTRTISGVTYAQAAKNMGSNGPIQKQQQTMMQKIETIIDMMQKFSTRLDRLEAANTRVVAREQK